MIKLGRHIRQVDPSLLTESADWAESFKATPKPTEWATVINAINVSQPDEVTCQASCIAMAVGDRDVMKIRRALLARGNPGSPAVMGLSVAKRSWNDGYDTYNPNLRLPPQGIEKPRDEHGRFVSPDR